MSAARKAGTVIEGFRKQRAGHWWDGDLRLRAEAGQVGDVWGIDTSGRDPWVPMGVVQDLIAQMPAEPITDCSIDAVTARLNAIQEARHVAVHEVAAAVRASIVVPACDECGLQFFVANGVTYWFAAPGQAGFSSATQARACGYFMDPVFPVLDALVADGSALGSWVQEYAATGTLKCKCCHGEGLDADGDRCAFCAGTGLK